MQTFLRNREVTEFVSGALAGAMTVPCHRFCLSPDTGLLVDLPRCVFPFQLLVFAMFLMCFAM
jgi:hypothetical protein